MVRLGVIRPPSAALLDDMHKRKRKAHDRAASLRGLEGNEYKRRLKVAKADLDFYLGAMIPKFAPDLEADEAA